MNPSEKNPLPAHLVLQWHPTKNGKLLPSEISAGSKRDVWWYRKECGHEWHAKIYTRHNQGCAVCAGKQIQQGVNDLASQYPEIALEWEESANGVPATAVIAKSERRGIWRGKCGHLWETSVSSRTAQGTGCPFCTGNRVLNGFNDLATREPALSTQWHPTQNSGLTPEQVSFGSNKKVWWKCEVGHSWAATIANRVGGTGCPYCTGRRALPGYNDLTTTHPELAVTLDDPKYDSDSLTAGSTKSVRWKCPEGHFFLQTPYNRIAGHGCPVCANKQVESGFNDLATTHPALVVEWAEDNTEKANQVSYGSKYLATWVCKVDNTHTWRAQVKDRTRGTGCPECAAAASTSRGEAEIAEYLTEGLGLTVLRNQRNIIPGYELDIFLPGKNLAVEFNGIYWHSEKAGKPKTYHHDKYLVAKNHGIRLIQIWEDDWKDRQEVVKTLLAVRLGAQQQERLPARKAEIRETSKQSAEEFLSLNHIQGYVAGSHYLGAYAPDGSLAALLVLRRQSDGYLNIVRYATDRNVQGGFTRLLAHAAALYRPTGFLTFSDNTISEGALYAASGFNREAELAPDYMYVSKGRRYHKFGYRLERFKNDPALKYQADLTERELAALNGLYRIYDAGKIRWRLTLNRH